MKNIELKQLIAYLDGVADQSIVSLIESNTEYLAQVELLAKSQREFWLPITRLSLPNEMVLGEYVLGVLSPDAAAKVEAQVAQFPHLAAKLAQIRVDLNNVQFSQTAESSHNDFFASAQIWLAERVVDLSMGLKSAESHKFQQGSFETNGVQISLNTSHDLNQHGRIRLSGMVSGEIGDDVSVRLHLGQDAEPIAETTLNEFDTFIFDGLESGRYMLIITSQNQLFELHVPPIEI